MRSEHPAGRSAPQRRIAPKAALCPRCRHRKRGMSLTHQQEGQGEVSLHASATASGRKPARRSTEISSQRERALSGSPASRLLGQYALAVARYLEVRRGIAGAMDRFTASGHGRGHLRPPPRSTYRRSRPLPLHFGQMPSSTCQPPGLEGSGQRSLTCPPPSQRLQRGPVGGRMRGKKNTAAAMMARNTIQTSSGTR